MGNRITGSNRVDATFVHGEQTFLLSGDEYVRYTGSNYQYVDAGYPRPIAGFLRQEAPFQQLPADVEIAFKELKPEDVWLAAAFCTGGVVYVRVAGQSYALSAQLSRSYPLQQITRVRNELVSRESARDDYGVVIEPATRRVDEAATAALRAALRERRGWSERPVVSR